MNARARFFATFTGAAVDRVPVAHIGFASEVASRILGREAYVGGGVQQWREAGARWHGRAAHQEFLARSAKDAYDLTRATGQDLCRTEYWRLHARPAARLDEHTYRFEPGDGAWMVRRYDPATEQFLVAAQGGPPPAALDTFAALERQVRLAEAAAAAEGADPPADAAARDLMQRYGQDLALRFGAAGLSIPYDPPLWLEAVVERPDLVERCLDVQVHRGVRQCQALAAAGVKLVFGGGDLASNAGPFYSPAVFRELVLPRLQRLVATAHALGLYYAFASDGNLWPIADALFGRSGVDAYYEIDRRAGMDLGRLRQRYPHLTLIAGNLSSHTLHRGTPADVTREARECLDLARAHGRISVGLSNYAVPGTPPANVEALLETLARYR